VPLYVGRVGKVVLYLPTFLFKFRSFDSCRHIERWLWTVGIRTAIGCRPPVRLLFPLPLRLEAFFFFGLWLTNHPHRGPDQRFITFNWTLLRSRMLGCFTLLATFHHSFPSGRKSLYFPLFCTGVSPFLGQFEVSFGVCVFEVFSPLALSGRGGYPGVGASSATFFLPFDTTTGACRCVSGRIGFVQLGFRPIDLLSVTKPLWLLFWFMRASPRLFVRVADDFPPSSDEMLEDFFFLCPVSLFL